MIKLEQLTKIFNAGSAMEVTALNAINIVLKKSEFVIITGSNGSGKSTLLNLVAGAVSPTSGKIYIDEHEVSHYAEHQRSKLIARVFQNPLAGTASDLSILENFRLAAIRTQPKKLAIGTGSAFQKLVKEKIAGLGLGLENKINQPMGTLSGGQRQALTLLMAVMDKAELILLDEPTAALDPKTATRIMDLTQKIINDHQLTAILVTHNLKDAIAYGSRIVHMKEGSINKDIYKVENKELELTDLLDWF